MLHRAILLVLSLSAVIASSNEERGPPSPPGAQSEELIAVAKRAYCPEGGGDKKPGCGYWKKLGYCNPSKGYYDFMEASCPASCNMCQARPTPPPTAGLARVNKQECLRAHNTKRALHRARPLVWDDSLAQDASKWALKLAKMNKFIHAPYSGQGENLYYIARVSSKPPTTCMDAVKAWYDEVEDYPFSRPPATIYEVSGAPIGHFTQIVWKNTKRVGVAISTIKRGIWYKTYVVARYTPPGNYNNEFQQQVGELVVF